MNPLASFFGTKATAVTQKDTEVLQNPPDHLKSIENHHLFTRDSYRVLLKVALGQAFVALALVVVSIVLLFQANPNDRFFVSSISGRIESVIPLDQPLMTDDEVFSRVADDIAAALTFGFLDKEQRRKLSVDAFEPGTLDSLQKAVLTSAALDNLLARALVFSAKIDPSLGGGILDKGIHDTHIYYWVVQVPLRLSVQEGLGATRARQTPWLVTVEVQRSRSIDLGRNYTVTTIERAQQIGDEVSVELASDSQPKAEGTP